MFRKRYLKKILINQIISKLKHFNLFEKLKQYAHARERFYLLLSILTNKKKLKFLRRF